MAVTQKDLAEAYEGPVEQDPLVRAFEDFKVNSVYYARWWLNAGMGDPHVAEHPIITEKLTPWRAALRGVPEERRRAVIAHILG